MKTRIWIKFSAHVLAGFIATAIAHVLAAFTEVRA
mgnify:FL=1